MSDEDPIKRTASVLRGKPDPGNPRTKAALERKAVMDRVKSRRVGEIPSHGLFPFVPNCPLCQNDVWEMRGPKDPAAYFEATTTGQVWNDAIDTPEQVILPTVAFVCSRCGFIRHHAIDKMDQLP